MKKYSVFFCLITSCLTTHLFSQSSALLWRISGKGLSAPSYLFGTIHITNKEVFDLNDSVLQSLVNAEALALEFNPDSVSRLLERMDFKTRNEKTIEELLDGDEIQRLEQFLKKNRKRPIKNLKKLTAMELYEELSGFSFLGEDKNEENANTMLDGWLYNVAREYGKKIFGLEDMDKSISLVKNIPENEQKKMVLSLMDSSNVMDDTEGKLLDLYLHENISEIENQVNQSATDYMKDTLLVARNYYMAKEMIKIIQSNTCFFAVGTAHLPGEEGLINLMRKEGYTVDPVVAPKTGYGKKFIKEKSEVKWITFSDSSYGYRVNMPGQPGLMDFGGFTMNGYFDLGTGGVYFSMAFPADEKKARDPYEVFKGFEKGYSKSGKVTDKKKVTYQNFPAYEFTLLNDKMNTRVRLLIRENTLYLFIIGSMAKKEVSQDNSEAFFNSINFFTPIDNGNVNFISDSSAFSVTAPGIMKLESTEDKDNFHERTWSCHDKKNGIRYSVSCFDYGFGRFFSEQQKIFDLLLSNFEEYSPSVTYEKFLGYNSMRLKFGTVKDGFGEIIYVSRESRLYTIIALGSQEKTISRTAEFINSFRFIPYLPVAFLPYRSPQNDFTVVMPPLRSNKKLSAEKEEENGAADDTTTSYHFALDVTSGASFNIIHERYDPYLYVADNDTAFFKQMVALFHPVDSIVSFQFSKKANTYSATAKTALLKNSSYAVQTKIVINGRNIYTLSCYQPDNPVGDSTTLKFFNSFRLLNEDKEDDIFRSRLPQLLSALQTADEAEADKHRETLAGYEINMSDRLALEKSLTVKYHDDNEMGKTIRYTIYSRLFETIEDSTERAQYVVKNYNQFSRNPLLEILALSQMADHFEKENYLLLKNKLIADKPQVENISDVYTLFSKFYQEGNKASKYLYPELLSLASDSLYKEPVYYATGQLLSKDILAPAEVTSIKEKLVSESLSELNAMKKDTIENKDNYSELLDDYLKILIHFNSDEKIISLDEIIISNNFYSYYYDAIRHMAFNRRQPDVKALERCLELPQFRYRIYAALDTAKQIGWFPEKFKKQRFFAEADLYDYLVSNEAEPEKTQFVETYSVVNDGKKKNMFVFKVFYPVEETGESKAYLAWAGPYLANDTVLDLEGGGWTGSDFEEWDNKTYKDKIKTVINRESE